MLNNWKYRTSEVLIDDGYYYIDGMIFINLEKYKDLHDYFFKESAKPVELVFNIAIPSKDKAVHKFRKLGLDTNNMILIQDTRNISDEDKEDIRRKISDVEQWVRRLDTGKTSIIFDSVKYVKYIADLLRTRKIVLIQTSIINRLYYGDNKKEIV